MFRSGNAADDYYVKPWCRIGPYIVGFVAGYILYRLDCKLKIPKVGKLKSFMNHFNLFNYLFLISLSLPQFVYRLSLTLFPNCINPLTISMQFIHHLVKQIHYCKCYCVCDDIMDIDRQ